MIINLFFSVQTLFFDEVIAEPDGTHSLDCVWKLSNTCFECWKNLCYKFLTLCCGCCVAGEWGCEFAYIAFCHVWLVTPFLKILEINCGVCRRFYSLLVGCCLTPCFEACGGVFHHCKR